MWQANRLTVYCSARCIYPIAHCSCLLDNGEHNYTTILRHVPNPIQSAIDRYMRIQRMTDNAKQIGVGVLLYLLMLRVLLMVRGKRSMRILPLQLLGCWDDASTGLLLKVVWAA